MRRACRPVPPSRSRLSKHFDHVVVESLQPSGTSTVHPSRQPRSVMKRHEDLTESSTRTPENDDPVLLVSSSERESTTAVLLSSTVSGNTGGGAAGGGGVLGDHHHSFNDYVLHEDHHHNVIINNNNNNNLDEEDLPDGRSECDNYSQHSSTNSSTEGIEIYRRQSAGGDSSKSLSSNRKHRRSSSSKSSSSSFPRNLSSCLTRSTGFVKHVYYKRAVLMSIAFCSALLGLQTTSYMDRASEAQQEGLERVVRGFLILFTLQVGLEVLQYHTKIVKLLSRHTFFFHPPSTQPTRRHRTGHSITTTNQHAACWALFDAGVVTLAWMVTPTLLVLQCFNVLKGLRRAKGLSEVRVLVQAMTTALPRVVALLALMAVVIYVFAVLFTHFYGDRVVYFQRLDRAAWTLFQLLTLDGWVEIANDTMQVYPHSWILLSVYLVVVVGFGLSLLIGVVSQAVAQAASERVLTSLQDVPPPPPPQPSHYDSPTILASSRRQSPRSRTHTLSSIPTVHLPLDGFDDFGGTSATTLPTSSTYYAASVGNTPWAASSSVAATSSSSSDMIRLERKLDSLSAQVGQLLRLQASIQQELARRKLE